MPSYSEMAKLFGFKSKNAVYRVVQKFLDAGFVEKDAIGRIVPSASFGEVPFVGLVKAGLPADATELTDTLDIEQFLLPKKEKTYIFEVDGESMIDAHIADGDMVVAEASNTARPGEIVIARVDGEFTMKYFRKEGSKVWLEPANKAFKPIHPERELEIIAVVRSVMRKY
jgi:repressor LexA